MRLAQPSQYRASFLTCSLLCRLRTVPASHSTTSTRRRGQPTVTSTPATPILAGLRAVPGGFGQPTFADFAAAFMGAAQQAAIAKTLPPVLFVMGEPLAGKSTFLSQLFVRLTQADAAAGQPTSSTLPGAQPAVRPYLIRWGDTIREGKKVGVVAPERQFGDLTPDEFARTSGRLAEAARAARQAATGYGPALVVVEAPGVTMLTTAPGQTRGLDRGYSFARTLAHDPGGYVLALAADQQVRDAHLATRQAHLTTGSPDVREATQLAANRIRAQVTDLLYDLAQAGTIRLPEPAPAAPLTRAALDADSAYRNEAVLQAYLPYLFQHDLGIPPERAFIGLNGFQGAGVAPDMALLDRYDWTHEHFGI